MKSSFRDHPNAPHNQPFKGAGKTKRNHWSNVRGHNNAPFKKDDK